MSETLPTLGIIAGAGALPLELVSACKEQNRDVFVLGIEGAADMAAVSHVPHASVRIGAVGDAIQHMHAHQVKQIVLAGGVKRPSILSLRPDAKGAQLMARLGKKLFSGDDALLSALTEFFEEEGFTVIGADDVLGALSMTEGALGEYAPDAQARDDIALGIKAARALGALDIGQAVIVENGYVLGVEAAEGTDALIARCGALKREPRGGVLVKVKKPGQERRADLPSIGVDTIRRVHEIGLSGIALEAGSSLVINRADTVKCADELGIFVIGVH